MKAKTLIHQAQNAEQELKRASESLQNRVQHVQTKFQQNAAWLVPTAGIGSGLLLANTSGRWRDRLLYRLVPMLGGGGFSLAFAVLKRRGWL